MIEAAQQVQKGRFSAAARPDDGHRLAGLDGKGYAGERNDPPTVEFTPHVVEFDKRHSVDRGYRKRRRFRILAMSCAMEPPFDFSSVAASSRAATATDAPSTSTSATATFVPDECRRQSSSPVWPSTNFTCETTTTSPPSSVRA